MPGPIGEIDEFSKWRLTVLLAGATPAQQEHFRTELARLFEKCKAVRTVSDAKITAEGGTITGKFDLKGKLDPDQCDLLRGKIRTFRDRTELRVEKELQWDPPEDGWRKLGVSDP
jgi:hypothetical protein